MTTEATVTDAVMVRAVAEWITGGRCGDTSCDGVGVYLSGLRYWNPLEHDAACAQVLDALAAHLDSRLELSPCEYADDPALTWWYCITGQHDGESQEVRAASRRRAIVLCAYAVVQTTGDEAS